MPKIVEILLRQMRLPLCAALSVKKEGAKHVLTFSKEMYPKIALLKSAYAFTDRAYLHLDAKEDYYLVEIRPKDGQEVVTEDEFVNEMLCQCVRHKIYEQTKTVRELLVARAMASSVIEQPDTASYEEIEQLPLEEETQILRDWFDLYDDSQTE